MRPPTGAFFCVCAQLYTLYKRAIGRSRAEPQTESHHNTKPKQQTATPQKQNPSPVAHPKAKRNAKLLHKQPFLAVLLQKAALHFLCNACFLRSVAQKAKRQGKISTNTKPPCPFVWAWGLLASVGSFFGEHKVLCVTGKRVLSMAGIPRKKERNIGHSFFVLCREKHKEYWVYSCR